VTTNAARTDLSGVVFVPNDLTTRLGEAPRQVAIEANALLEDCIAAFSKQPAPEIVVEHGHKKGDRTATVTTRFGETTLRLSKERVGKTTDLTIGSLMISTPIPWTRPAAADVVAICRFVREAVRSVVLRERVDEIVLDIRSKLAVATQEHPDVYQTEAVAPTPWAPHGSITRQYRGKPFGSSKTFLKTKRAMEVQVVQGATTPPGGPKVAPTVSIKPLRIILSKDFVDPVEMLRLLQHAGVVTDEPNEGDPA
jgi:hypothetical protein